MSSNVHQRSKNQSTEDSSSSSIVHRKEAKPIIIDGQIDIYSVAFPVEGEHIVSGDDAGKIRRWRIEDGKQVTTMDSDAGNGVLDIAVSRDGKWIVGGTKGGLVTVWDAESHSKVTEFKAHRGYVRAVDISPEATKIATGSNDKTACVWLLSTGERLLGPLEHNFWVAAAKFSPDGLLIATATWNSDSGLGVTVRVYDSQNGSLIVELPVKVNSALNQSLAWASDSKQLFALSYNGYILRVDVSTGTALSKWLIHSHKNPKCIALASNGTFVATSARSSVSFWDTTSQEQIGTVIQYTHKVESMAMSSNYDLATSGGEKMTLRALCGTLPSHYLNKHTERAKVDDSPDERMANLEKTITIQELRIQLAESQQQAHRERDNLTQSLRTQEGSSNSKIARLEKHVQELHDKLAESQRAANRDKDRLNETINSLRANLRSRDESSSGRITHLEQTIQELHVQLAEAERKADRLIRINHAHEQKDQCESMYAQGRIHVAAKCLLEIVNTVNNDVRTNKFIFDWLPDFTSRCVMALERDGDRASNAGKLDEAVASYSAALSLGPSAPNAMMMKWVNVTLKRSSAHEASSAATKFKVPWVVVYRAICDILERDGRLTEAVEFCRQTLKELQA